MNFLKKLFSAKDKPINSYADFWNWFQKNEKAFHKVVKTQHNLESDFFDKLSPKLDEIKDGIYFLTGMCDEKTAELVLTAEGIAQTIVFIEELVAAAPPLQGWKFTTLKPALDIKDVNIGMQGYDFKKENIHFYSNEHPDYPDEIDITIVHDDYNEENKNVITNGTYIFLDNYLGELNFVTIIDDMRFIPKDQAEKELVPIEKLNAFLNWRQKEFIEKYDGKRRNTEEDSYSIFEGKLENDQAIVAVINSDLLQWDAKASHPWVLTVEMPYDGTENNGMPEKDVFELLNQIEEDILSELKDFEGYLNIGRQTGQNNRQIFFACKEFRKPSKVLFNLSKKYGQQIEIKCDLYKDKYWRSFNRFAKHS